MCGIVGAFFKKEISEQSLKIALESLAHRGPDASGHFISEDRKLFLGHRRLSIIDISNGANQPMFSADGRYVIIYNGEVYNFEELKKKIPNFAWKTKGDTEVVLELFANFGVSCFQWLNGIFAFSIFDIKNEKLYVCRDQLGVKPLFILRNKEKVIVASELKAIIEANKDQEKKTNYLISKTAVAQFLHLGYIPEPLTIYRGIKKFPAGNYASLDLKTNEWNRQAYWNAKDYYLQNKVGQKEELLKVYQDKLYAAIDRQMVSDVPLGTFLSGGIDSSLVTAVASKISKHKVKTFSIGFEDPKFDESVYAQKVASHLQTEHHEFKVKLEDILELVPEFIDIYDEPFADSSAFPTMLVSKLAKKSVTVTLSGDGGDEFFQGYGMYTWAKRLQQPQVQVLHKPIYWASKFMDERRQRAGKVFNYSSSHTKRSHIFSQEQYLFSEQELKRLLVKNNFNFKDLNTVPKNGTAQEKQAFWDIEHYLKDDLLVKVDRASMHYSLETRVPLLDKDLVEFSLNLPLEFKVNNEFGAKYFMKETLYQMVPKEIFDRPKKGFSIPMHLWLANELKPMLTKYLSQQQVEYAGLVEYTVVKDLLKKYLAGKTYLYNRVWALLVLHWWYYKNY